MNVLSDWLSREVVPNLIKQETCMNDGASATQILAREIIFD